jgi:hypothetical protein
MWWNANTKPRVQETKWSTIDNGFKLINMTGESDYVYDREWASPAEDAILNGNPLTVKDANPKIRSMYTMT